MKWEYYVLIEGRFKNDSGIIDKFLGRNKKDRLKMGIVEDGKRVVIYYEVIERYNGYILIKCILEIGRIY